MPSEESASGNTSACMSPISMVSMSSDIESSPARQPPPYRAPPQVSPAPLTSSVPASMTTVGLPILEPQTKTQYKECVDEFKQAVSSFMDTNRAVERVDVTSRKNSFEQIIEDNSPPTLPPRKRSSIDSRSLSRENSLDQSEKEDFNKENMQSTDSINALETEENKISVKEAMIKFNRYASEEDAKIPSPMGKNKKPEKVSVKILMKTHVLHRIYRAKVCCYYFLNVHSSISTMICYYFFYLPNEENINRDSFKNISPINDSTKVSTVS